MAQKLSYRPVYGKDQPSKILTHLDQLPKIEAARRKIDTLLEELAQDVAQAGDEPLASTPESYLSAANSKLSKKKIFVPRESVLSRLLSDVNIQTIYNIALAILAWFFVGLCAQDYFDKNEVIDLSLLWWCFGKFHLVVIIWFAMFIGSFIIVPIAEGGRSRSLPPIVLAIIVPLLYTAYIVIPGYFVITLDLPTASSMTVLAESVRIAMKMHAYFRERMSSPKWPSRSNYQSIEEIQSAREAEKSSDDKKWNEKQQRNKKKETEEESAEERKQQAEKTKRRHSDAVENDHDAILKGSQASRYAYFFFAPTLVYREVYPRIPRIRWEFVVRRALECIGCILYTVVIFQKYVISPDLRDVKSPDFNTWRNIVLSTFNCMVPGTLAMFLGFFTLLHCWMNMMAELTQFADREFYEDWWNAPGFHAYYRKWNLVVHEWLFYYFYLDLKALGVSSLLCKMLVFVVSAIFHEIIISLTMKSFLPILAIEFICFAPIIIGISKALSDISPQAGNLFVWINFFLGNGILMVVYSREWYMRMDMEKWPSGWQTLVPVSWAVFF